MELLLADVEDEYIPMDPIYTEPPLEKPDQPTTTGETLSHTLSDVEINIHWNIFNMNSKRLTKKNCSGILFCIRWVQIRTCNSVHIYVIQKVPLYLIVCSIRTYYILSLLHGAVTMYTYETVLLNTPMQLSSHNNIIV